MQGYKIDYGKVNAESADDEKEIVAPIVNSKFQKIKVPT